ncbi:MAG: DUF1036 domain-containing protein [Blastocatellia bacterium]
MRNNHSPRISTFVSSFILVAAIAATVQTANAQEYGGSIVTFHNKDTKTVKVCIYGGLAQLYPLAEKCMTLKPGERERWDHKGRRHFTVYVFEPALIDELRCKQTPPNDPAYVEILPKGSRSCVKTTERLDGPKPDPNRPPDVSRSDNMLAVCNLSSQEPLHFAITYATGQSGYFTEGWWRLIKNQCLEINLEDLWYKQKLPPHYRFKTYIYAETEGKFGGAVKKVWEGDDPKFAFCINDEKKKQFGNKHQDASDGALVWESDCTTANGKRMVKMWPITVPKLGDPWKWNF